MHLRPHPRCAPVLRLARQADDAAGHHHVGVRELGVGVHHVVQADLIVLGDLQVSERDQLADLRNRSSLEKHTGLRQCAWRVCGSNARATWVIGPSPQTESPQCPACSCSARLHGQARGGKCTDMRSAERGPPFKPVSAAFPAWRRCAGWRPSGIGSTPGACAAWEPGEVGRGSARPVVREAARAATRPAGATCAHTGRVAIGGFRSLRSTCTCAGGAKWPASRPPPQPPRPTYADGCRPHRALPITDRAPQSPAWPASSARAHRSAAFSMVAGCTSSGRLPRRSSITAPVSEKTAAAAPPANALLASKPPTRRSMCCVGAGAAGQQVGLLLALHSSRMIQATQSQPVQARCSPGSNHRADRRRRHLRGHACEQPPNRLHLLQHSCSCKPCKSLTKAGTSVKRTEEH